MAKVLVPIVEGQSEVESAGVLLRRLLHAEGAFDWSVAKPFRVKRNKVVRDGELEKAITQAQRSRGGAGAIVVVLDADDDCPAELGPGLTERARAATDLPVAVVLAEREFEGWLLGSKESLRAVRGIAANAVAPPNPQAIRDAKGELSRNMAGGRRYIAVDDQPALVESLDLDLAAERCSSFKRLVRAVGGLRGAGTDR
jgi:Domain of unknown function (DUF4276)